jgi:alpha-beta hydrolase superfamily lysophospholipase
MRRSAALAIGSWFIAACAAAPPYAPPRAPDRPTLVADDVDHAEGTFVGHGGVKLFEQSWRPRGETRGVLVVVHGLKDHSGRYGDFAVQALHRGFAVHAFDLRGHGRSEGSPVYVDSFDDYLADLDLFLAEVRKKDPHPPVVFGHSMGGAIVTLYGLTRTTPLKGTILSGAALEADVSGATVLGTKLVAALSPRAAVFQLDLDDFSRDPASVWWTRVDPLVYQDPAPARTAKEVLGAIDRIQGRMEDVRGPLLILHGGADKVTPPHGSRELYRRARATDKTLHVYDGLYHDLLHEPERDQVARDILEWLERHV